MVITLVNSLNVVLNPFRYDVDSDSFTLAEARLPSAISVHSTILVDNLCTNLTHISTLKTILSVVCIQAVEKRTSLAIFGLLYSCFTD